MIFRTASRKGDGYGNLRPDYIIQDEFHRIGTEKWGEGVKKLLKLYPDAKLLGLSATNIRYLDNQRDMADELFDGNVASEMTLGEAIVRGILNAPKYVLSVFAYQEDYDRLRSRVRRAKCKAVHDEAEKYLEALRRALEHADGLDVIFDRHMTDRRGKYLVFCANVEYMREMMDHVPEWFGEIDARPHVYSAYADDPAASKAFRDFKADSSEHLKLLFCIDMLNEGIHVEDVSGVILFRPTVSPIIYKQQIGRALSASKTKDPIIFDVVNNIENLYSIGTVEQEMQAAISYYRFYGDGKEIVNERFKLIDELRDARELFEQLNDTLTASWDLMYEYARQYYELHGDLKVPHKYKTDGGYNLEAWLQTQRKVYAGERYDNLSGERIEKLNAIGMCWGSYLDLSWDRHYQAAKEYYEKHGNLKITAAETTDSGVRLGAWIANLRTYKKSAIRCAYLSQERVEALEKIGMVWDVADYLWEENFAAAIQYYREHGDLDMPAFYVAPNGLRVGMWIQRLRMKRVRGEGCAGTELTQEQIARLDSIGMIWEPKHERAWNRGYAEARTYYAEHGDLNVPRMYVSPTGYKLGQWLPYLEEHIAQKKVIYLHYKEGFKDLPVTMNPYDEQNSEPSFWLSCLLIDEGAMCRQVRSETDALYVSEPGKSCPTEILETLAKYNAEGRPIWKPMHMQPIYRNCAFITREESGRARTNAYIAGESMDVGMDIFARGLCLPSDIRFIPLSVPNFEGNERKYVDDAIDQGWVSTGGAYITRLEENLAGVLNTAEVSACQSGTAALHLSLIEAGIVPGEKTSDMSSGKSRKCYRSTLMIDQLLQKFTTTADNAVVNVMSKIDSNAQGILFVVDGGGRLIGCITDGDIRRWIIKTGDLDAAAGQYMNRNPRSLPLESRKDAPAYMRAHSIRTVPLLDAGKRIVDIVFADSMYASQLHKNENLKNTPVVIMAGGMGTRLYPYTKILPKPLIPIGDVPILERIINRFCEYGVSRFYLTLNYKKGMIKSILRICRLNMRYVTWKRTSPSARRAASS